MKKRMGRFEFASQFSDKEKITYFKSKIEEMRKNGDFAKCSEYRIKLSNLENRILRDKLEAQRRKERDDFLNFD